MINIMMFSGCCKDGIFDMGVLMAFSGNDSMMNQACALQVVTPQQMVLQAQTKSLIRIIIDDHNSMHVTPSSQG